MDCGTFRKKRTRVYFWLLSPDVPHGALSIYYLACPPLSAPHLWTPKGTIINPPLHTSDWIRCLHLFLLHCPVGLSPPQPGPPSRGWLSALLNPLVATFPRSRPRRPSSIRLAPSGIHHERTHHSHTAFPAMGALSCPETIIIRGILCLFIRRNHAPPFFFLFSDSPGGKNPKSFRRTPILPALNTQNSEWCGSCRCFLFNYRASHSKGS